ncbi:hypothetical protein [Mycolicibacter virginiensis]|uniref:hypothetical protein n=1 Tax=Mycolicibacter virginiensis TaxID=1795032 RepID=UPI001F04989B|nr:hypothetical protein [Mycolicibacter virginiensis]ULP45907.1 hypothetical protein MJO54_13610 [Mycolicibacter virginiensis]
MNLLRHRHARRLTAWVAEALQQTPLPAGVTVQVRGRHIAVVDAAGATAVGGFVYTRGDVETLLTIARDALAHRPRTVRDVELPPTL